MPSGKPHLASKRKPTGGKAGLYDATLAAANAHPQVEAEGEEPAQKRPRASSVDSDDLDGPVASTSQQQVENVATSPKTGAVLVKAQGKAKRSTRQKKTSKNAKGKGKASDFVSTIDWPEHFIKLEQVFKALNTVYTFCQARRHLATTFDTLRSSVEGLLKRPLVVHDVAQIRALLPGLVNFIYVDPEALQVLQANAANNQPDHYAAPNTTVPPGSPHVLLFQFNDGELRAVGGTGKAITKRWRRNKDKTDAQHPTNGKDSLHQGQKANPTPVFTASSMSKLIDRRNQVFRQAVDELLVAAAAQDLDALTLLLEATEEHVPVQPADPSSASSSSNKPLSERRADLDFFLRHPQNRPSIENILLDMQEEEWYDGQIVPNGHRIVESREPQYGTLDTPLSDFIMDALWQTKSITSLYTHQAEAIKHLGRGDNVIVSTSTSSGKSLIYQLPALSAFEKDPESTVMFIFPTKALAQDQKRALGELLSHCPELGDVKIATFDGDTPFQDRQYIREKANVIFTNPDMLHCTILPMEEEWRRFFTNLKFVVVDELHVYDGLFGCHVAYVMRRLRRMCSAVGNQGVKFISCSATIAHPERHMRTIFGVEDVHVVSQDGSPAGRKEHVVWNAPFVDPDNPTQGRVHSITETSRVFRFLMERGIRAIVFCKIRKMCELVMKQVRQDLADAGRSDMVQRVMAYRSGYNAEDRRVIERKMFNGELLGIVATTALELGIDIGSLDAVITVGFPYTLAGLRQQSGRAGRRNKDSLSMLICDPWPLDQHYARCPDDLYNKPPSEVSLDLNNEIVLDGHLSCAAEELPIHPEEDARWFGPDLPQMCELRLIKDDEGYYHCHPRYQPNAARHVSLRATEDVHYAVVDVTGDRYVVLEETEWSRAVFSVYEGAVFLHQGKTFLVQSVDHASKLAKIVESNVDWSTRQRDFTDVDAVEAFRVREIRDSDCTANYGKVKVTSKVFGYFKVDRKNNILDTVEIDQPPFIRDTHGLWLDVPKRALDILTLKNIHVAGSVHAAEHALLSLTPMFAMSVAGDVRTECKAPEKELASRATRRVRPARLTLYDASGSKSGGGICVKAFDRITDLVNQALEVILECPCEDGCPSCVSSTVCSEGNIVLAKIGAMIVLACLAGRDIDVDAIPEQEPLEGEGQKAIETIQLADPVKTSETTVRLASDGSTINRLADAALQGAK